MNQRKLQLTENLQNLRRRIESAAHSAKRNPAEVQLLAVSKTWPASDVRLLNELGIRDFAENRAQEAVAKSAELADLNLRWHHVGQIQTNKSKAIVSYADVVHSIDRESAALAINAAAVKAKKLVDVYLQVSLDAAEAEHRAGVQPADLMELAAITAALSNLNLVGLMAVAPLDEPSAQAFARLQPVVSQFVSEFPSATNLSIGMSDDFEVAIAAGATHIRIGSILFGNRSYSL